MNPTHMDFEVTDVRGCAYLLRAVNVEDGEWHLKASVDGRTFTHRCKNWQAVERTLRWLRARALQRRATGSARPPIRRSSMYRASRCRWTRPIRQAVQTANV